MPSTPTLRPPRLALEIAPLARVRSDGALELLGPAFPPWGPLLLTLWRPGSEPAFRIVRGSLARGWRWEGPPADGWVVCWLPVGDPSEPI